MGMWLDVMESSGDDGDGYERLGGVIPESNESEREGLGLSTNAGMSWQRVEGVKKGVMGCAHRRRWQM